MAPLPTPAPTFTATTQHWKVPSFPESTPAPTTPVDSAPTAPVEAPAESIYVSTAEHVPPTEGTIEVTLFGAEKLLGIDEEGLSDCYAVMKYEGQTAISSVKPKTINPAWNETFIFRIIDPHLLDGLVDVLTVEIFGKRSGKPDDSLGMAVFSLGGLVSGKEKEMTVPLGGVPESLGSTIKVGLYPSIDTPPDHHHPDAVPAVMGT
eukprot:TRINITY_DN444_c0_g1_i2.p2 TRINITY_DN444_c0_g1~~TRINITY_DN444_c0_g1_i2.p2  ORF type:complete len:206 (-),score=6.82 TRINITY_DN444_c0_g1_i2:115-732(-)